MIHDLHARHEEGSSGFGFEVFGVFEGQAPPRILVSALVLSLRHYAEMPFEKQLGIASIINSTGAGQRT